MAIYPSPCSIGGLQVVFPIGEQVLHRQRVAVGFAGGFSAQEKTMSLFSEMDGSVLQTRSKREEFISCFFALEHPSRPGCRRTQEGDPLDGWMVLFWASNPERSCFISATMFLFKVTEGESVRKRKNIYNTFTALQMHKSLAACHLFLSPLLTVIQVSNHMCMAFYMSSTEDYPSGCGSQNTGTHRSFNPFASQPGPFKILHSLA